MVLFYTIITINYYEVRDLAKHNKELTQKQKIIIYISCALVAAVAAIIATIAIVHIVKNPPPVISNSSKSNFTSNFSMLSTAPNTTISDNKNEEIDTSKQDKYISGVTDGETYFTTQRVAVKSENVDTITLNGLEVESNVFLISGNEEKIHKIVITFLDGTTHTVTIYTEPISNMLLPLSNINEYSATIDDKPAIDNIRNNARYTQTKYSPYEEVKAVNDVLTACDLMLNNIEKANQQFDDIKSRVNKIAGSTITNSNSEELDKLIPTPLPIIATELPNKIKF